MTPLAQECVQIPLFHNAKRPSPSPLSNRMTIFVPTGSKMDILLESDEGFFITLHFARECEPFLEGQTPARPRIAILDERYENRSGKPKPLCSQMLDFIVFGEDKGGVKRAHGPAQAKDRLRTTRVLRH